MINTERSTKIISILEEYGYISVSDLCTFLHASAPTVRRALTDLEREGIVLRNHGGVTLASNGLPKPFSYRFMNMRSEKRQIALSAVELIHDGSTVYLDTSTTVMCMIDYLKSRNNITVVTNSLAAIPLLNNYNIPVKCTGGDFNAESMGFVGYGAEYYLSEIHTDFAFFSTPAISSSGRVSDYSEQETYLRKVAMRNTSNAVYLFESQKYNQDATFSLGMIEDFRYLISNMDMQNSFTGRKLNQKTDKNGISIITM